MSVSSGFSLYFSKNRDLRFSSSASGKHTTLSVSHLFWLIEGREDVVVCVIPHAKQGRREVKPYLPLPLWWKPGYRWGMGVVVVNLLFPLHPGWICFKVTGGWPLPLDYLLCCQSHYIEWKKLMEVCFCWQTETGAEADRDSLYKCLRSFYKYLDNFSRQIILDLLSPAGSAWIIICFVFFLCGFAGRENCLPLCRPAIAAIHSAPGWILSQLCGLSLSLSSAWWNHF